MAGLIRRGLFEKFFEHRSYLIMQYENGDITKREFLEYNFNYIIQLNIKPFVNVDNYEKAMFNYQYYNGMAKYYRMLAKEVRNTKKHNKYYNYYLNLGNNNYNNKDNSLLSILKLQNFEHTEAYFIKMDSKALKYSLYEIVLTDKKEAIFHSKANWLLKILKEEKVFDDKIRSSIISQYINERY